MTTAIDITAKKLGLPVWAKILITIVVIGVLALLAFSIFTYNWIQNKVATSTKPSNISQVVSHIAEFSPSLPSGYKFTLGVGLLGTYTAIVEHMPDKQMIFFISYPKIDGDANYVVQQISQNGLQAQHTPAKFESVLSKGELIVGQEKMPYVIGVMSDRNRKYEALFGCVIPKGSKHTIFILAQEPSDKHFDLTVTSNLLKSIQKFN